MDESKEWKVLDLPFDMMASKSEVERTRIVDYEELKAGIDIYKMSIELESKKDLEFEFFLRDIQIFYHDSVCEAVERLPRKPYFYYALNDYSVSDVRDFYKTGQNRAGVYV